MYNTLLCFQDHIDKNDYLFKCNVVSFTSNSILLSRFYLNWDFISIKISLFTALILSQKIFSYDLTIFYIELWF